MVCFVCSKWNLRTGVYGVENRKIFKAIFDNKVHGVGIKSIIGVLHGSRVITIQESTFKIKRKEMKRKRYGTKGKIFVRGEK